MFAFRTVIIFAEGPAIATAKALIEAGGDVGGLNLGLRESVRLYYRARAPASRPTLCSRLTHARVHFASCHQAARFRGRGRESGGSPLPHARSAVYNRSPGVF